MNTNKLVIPFRTLIDQAADALIIEDASERILYANHRACRLFGFSEAELISMKTSDLEAADIPIIPSHIIYSNDPSSESDSFTTVARHKDGTTFQIEVSMSRIDHHSGSYIFSIIRDIKQKDQVHRHFRETSLLYQKIVEDTLQGIAILFPDPLKFAFVNYPLAAIFGRAVKELTALSGDKILTHLHPEDQLSFSNLIKDVLTKQGEHANGEFRIIRSDGELRWVEISCRCIRFESRQAIQANIIDTTDSKEIKNRLEQTRDQLQALLDAIPGAASWITSDLVYLGMNKQLADLYEKPQSYFIGKKVGFYRPENEFFRFVKKFFSQDHESASEEVVLRLRDKSPIYLVFGQKYDKGRSAVFVAIDITERKVVEEELRSSEDRFKRLVEYNPAAIIVHCKGIIVYANAASLRMVKAATADDVVGRAVMDFVHPEFRTLVMERVKTTQENGMVASPLEEKFLTIDGEAIDVEVTAIPTVFNETPATQVVFWDITEKKKSIESLRKSEALSKAIIEGSPTGVSVRSANGRLISVNDAWKKIWKIPDQDLRDDYERQREKLNFDERDDYLKPYHEEVRRVYETGGSLQIPEIKTKGTRKGSTKWISQYFYALTDDNGAVEQVVILTADITARKEAAEALQKRDRILESVSEAAGILLNTKDLLNGLNDAIRRLGRGADVSRVYVFKNSTGPSDHLITSQLSEWTAEGIIPQIDNPDLQNFELCETGFSRWCELLPRGQIIHGFVDECPESERLILEQQDILSILVVPIFVEEEWWGFIGFDHCTEKRTWSQAEIGALGSAAGIIGSTIVRHRREEEIQRINSELEQRIDARTNDLQLTNQALAESIQTLRKTYAQLIQSEKMAALGNLVAGIAHEIKTPVGIGVTAASHLLEKSDEVFRNMNSDQDPDIQIFIKRTNESAKIILTNLQRASDLIQSFKQVAVDQTSEQKRVFYLKEYLNSIMLSLKPELKKVEHLEINIDCPESLRIHGHPGLYSQIISNLVLNSITHGFENRHHGLIKIIVQSEGNRLKVIHEDNGSGIPIGNLRSIFEPFFTTKRGRGGTGLGLNLVYNLVTKNLNGTIRCDSVPDQSTRFTIEIPLDEGEKSEQTS
ncbi:PAS domain S-box protein [bacterium]|nr:PAS domain S-box protein [candidate division CSSED10-310 bacterium]